MKRKRVVIELIPGRIDVVTFNGTEPASSRRLKFTTDAEPDVWIAELSARASELAFAIKELHAQGGRATVLYRSPSQIVDLDSVAARSSSEAVEAARLACGEAMPYSIMSSVCEASAIGRDHGSESRNMQVVVAADRADIAQAIVEFVQKADLYVETITPLDAAVLANLVREALRTEEGRQAWLYVGEHFSSFIVMAGGRLVLSRQVSLGLETLARALTRPIRSVSGSTSIELTLDEARNLLRRGGIPSPQHVVCPERELRGSQLIPLLQPALQRFIVEVRQSLRFGLLEEERQELPISLTGPGAAIPGLAGLVHEELSVGIRAEARYEGAPWWEPGSPTSELRLAISRPRVLREMNLLPAPVAIDRRRRIVQRWLWTGAAAGLVLVIGDALRMMQALDEVNGQVQAQSARIAEYEQLQSTDAMLRTTLASLSKLDGTIQEEVGTRIDLRACLQELSRITPQSIRLSSVSVRRQVDGILANITGYAFHVEDESTYTEIENYIERLRASPLFEEVVLGNVQVGSIGAEEAQRFDVNFEILSVPSPQITAITRAAASGGEASP